MLPGKKYKPEDLLRVAKKRFWLLLVPFAIVSAGTAVWARKLPDYYRSSTLILVEPQRVPESYVKSTVTTRIEDRLGAIREKILSRTRLERLIEEFKLYPDELRLGIMQDVIEKMSREVQVNILSRGDAFSISYTGRNPQTVQKVTEKLATMFIDESNLDRENVADSATQFLDGSVEDVRRRLQESEKKVEDYRRAHVGALPTQLEANLQAFTNNALQIQSIVQQIHIDQNRRLLYEKQLADLENPNEIVQPIEVSPSAMTVGADGNPVGGTAQILAFYRGRLAELEGRKLLAGHPDVINTKKLIAEYEKKAEEEALQQPVTRPTVQVVPPAELVRRNRVAALRAELDQLTMQTNTKLAEEKRLRAEALKLQARIDATPTVESEMTNITRDYAQLSAQYASLIAKREDSKLAANLERRQIGEQFTLLDRARLPERPYEPDRQRINLLGMAAGLGIGLALLGFLEYRDASFKTDDEIMRVLSLPVLAVVPLMLSDAERRKSFRRRLLLHAGFGSVVTVCLAVLLYTFVR